MVGYKTLFAYLNERDQGKNMDYEKFMGLQINCGRFAYSQIPLKPNFDFIMGVTGTLKSITDLQKVKIEALYSINTYNFMPSIYKLQDRTKVFKPKEDIMILKKEDYFHKLAKQIELINSRPIIVVFEDIKKLNLFLNSNEYASLKSKTKYLIEEATESEKSEVRFEFFWIQGK